MASTIDIRLVAVSSLRRRRAIEIKIDGFELAAMLCVWQVVPSVVQAGRIVAR